MDTGPTCYVASHGRNPSLHHFDRNCRPAVLISYAYLQTWGQLDYRRRICYRHWMLDSGAYTAWTQGKEVKLEEYTAVARDLMAEDQSLREVIALDVIGNWRASAANARRMWDAGVPVIPVYHLGEPEDVLTGYARDYPKVCLGGVYLLKGEAAKRRYVEQAFARVWPCALHALAVSGVKEGLMGPFHSMDSSSAFRGANGFGTWQGYSGVRPSKKWQRIRALPDQTDHDVRVEVQFYLKGEALLRHRWRREMQEVADRLRKAGWRGYQGEEDDQLRQGPGDRPGHPQLARRA